MSCVINVTEKTNLGSEFILISLCNTAADVSLYKSKPALVRNLNEKAPMFDILRHAASDCNSRQEGSKETKERTRIGRARRKGSRDSFCYKHVLLSVTAL